MIRMEKRKEIKRQSYDLTVPDLFMLNSTNKLKGYDRYKHEQAAADLFVTFYKYISAWNFEPAIGKDRGDRGMIFQDKKIYFEVDRCTEGLPIIDEKLENYIQYGRETKEQFHVIFSLVGTENDVANRGDNLIPLLEDKKHGNQFLITNHNNLLDTPFDKVLFSPLDGIVDFNQLF